MTEVIPQFRACRGGPAWRDRHFAWRDKPAATLAPETEALLTGATANPLLIGRGLLPGETLTVGKALTLAASLGIFALPPGKRKTLGMATRDRFDLLDF